MENLYKKACEFFTRYTNGATLNDSNGKITFSVNGDTNIFRSYAEMYKQLELYVAIESDYEEESEMLFDFGFTQREIDKLLEEGC